MRHTGRRDASCSIEEEKPNKKITLTQYAHTLSNEEINKHMGAFSLHKPQILSYFKQKHVVNKLPANKL